MRTTSLLVVTLIAIGFGGLGTCMNCAGFLGTLVLPGMTAAFDEQLARTAGQDPAEHPAFLAKQKLEEATRPQNWLALIASPVMVLVSLSLVLFGSLALARKPLGRTGLQAAFGVAIAAVTLVTIAQIVLQIAAADAIKEATRELLRHPIGGGPAPTTGVEDIATSVMSFGTAASGGCAAVFAAAKIAIYVWCIVTLRRREQDAYFAQSGDAAPLAFGATNER